MVFLTDEGIGLTGWAPVAFFEWFLHKSRHSMKQCDQRGPPKWF